MFRNTMHAREAVSAGQAECYVTIEGNRYYMMQAISVEAKYTKTKIEVPIMGRSGMGNKSTGWKGTGTASFYFNTSIFRMLMKRFKETGEDVYFDMQLTNEDETSTVGRQTVILKDCNINSGILAKAEAGEGTLSEELEFTFEDFDIPEQFTDIDGMTE